ncbi:Cypemycin methyltransferase [Thalassovita gelatinovora]|uniref:Cypemycin methyltransferase n=1 Tax=Thalassovita gelatinovora TaxID=53501 RepID=A0A0P1FDI2_THAGE|nr:class I SAM-dependent methyltransferase [Thalassovita gelatinovora]QIZ81457.1 class I SAM-dependent methyltransferase [Thalassovita gelatinovora]CUH66281.1 Cypemycin methyltransferase [Thalassovita gelatinovora]SEQ22922.1 Methyltransferase domain-containing protein [Thalassovita gelatinovora]
MDPETIRIYDTRAQEYAQVTAAETPGRLLSDFIAAQPKGGSVLDLGCGPGIAAGWMAKAGLKVDATDASAEMVALAGQHPGVNAKQALFDDLDVVGRYDGIWANFSLLHAPRADMPRHLAAIHRALKPGGLFHMALKTGQGEKRDPIGRYYSYYSEPEVLDLLHAAGFTPTKIVHGRDKGLDEVVADWISVASHG